MKLKLNLFKILLLPLLIIAGCSHDEPATPTPPESVTPPTAPDPVTPPPAPAEKPDTPDNPPQKTDTPPPPVADANEPPVTLSLTEGYSQHPYNPQEEIAGAVSIFAYSLAEFDKEKYMSILYGDDLMKKVADATMDYLTAFHDFEIAYIATYGAYAWNKIASGATVMDPNTILENLVHMEINRRGDQAVSFLPGKSQPPVHLIRIDGLWYINLSLMFDYTAEQAQQIIDLWSKQIALVRDMQQRIGLPGYTSDRLNEEFARRWSEIKQNQ